MSTQPLGDLIGGRFLAPTGEAFSSHDPSHEHSVVLETASDAARAAEASAAAAEAWPAWAALSLDERWAHLSRFRDALVAAKDGLAEAITLEMGKIASEAKVEAGAVIGRFALVEAQVRSGLAGGELAGFPGEALRYRPHGVVAVLGPFNFPLHLCNAHVLPALLLGNTVVMKPSEVTPLAGQRYAEAALAAGLPAGVFNVVQGGGAVGAALVAAPEVRGLAFTGSWATGRRIAEATLDRPEMLLALEMGGKNVCVVREDAELRQAVHELVISGYLTTGQRCTCSDRVLVHRSLVKRLSEALRAVLGGLHLGDPNDANSFAGPLANRASHERFEKTVAAARASGKLDVVVEGGSPGGGAFAQPSLHVLHEGAQIEGYTDEEIFGPDLSLEVFDDDEEAIARLNQSKYGFAHSVFTADTSAFERYSHGLETGILNLNRSTNKASPRLPFGGRKRSGNFRPAGAWAGRNLVVPLAEIRQGDGVFDKNKSITPHLPAYDLDRLEARHAREECKEVGRTLLDTPRPQRTLLPEGGHLPQSAALHERYYAGDRFVRGEKKPLVVDHLRTAGPWMVSVDEAPLSVLDGMSQTATLPGGFAPDATVRSYAEGGFGAALLSSEDTTRGDEPHALAFAETLRELCPGFSTVSFVNSGAEANEKAYALCMNQAGEGHKTLVAFEGSFHGRTLLALYASFNPSKRGPFEIEGYEVSFARSPLTSPTSEDGPDPDGWRELFGAGDIEGAQQRFGHDPVLAAEVASLADLAGRLDSAFAVVVEPMQSEGGDRYLTSRWHRALRLLTRARGVALIVDEVQCGFGLGGSFLWHQRFGYVDKDGQPDHPDCVCFAKRAQVGVCLSRFDDPEPTNAFPASLARGRLHALSIGDGADAARVEALVKPRLEALFTRWSHLIETPRASGFALAFDLPSTAELMRYLGQRFWRGAVVFGAGSRTVRYRLSAAWDERTIETLFETMQRSLAWLEAHPGKSPPAWEDFAQGPEPKALPDDVTVRVATPEERETLLPAIVALEERTYEPARRDSPEKLGYGFEKGGVAIVAERGGVVVGSALGAPLERVADVPGPDADVFRGKDNTLYSLAVTVDPEHHGAGIGRALKLRQLERARAMRTADGSPRYHHVSARNRLPDASSMARLADSLGAYTVALLEGQYGDGGVARYYRQPLGTFRPGPIKPRGGTPIDLGAGLVRPLAKPPRSLAAYAEAGGLYGPAVTKLTVLNYLTPAIVRACEWAGALLPELPHVYLCSSRDETFDKAIRALRWHREGAGIVVGFEGEYVGHTSAAARSLSCPSTHRQGPAYFAWPRVPHPADGVEACIAALREVYGESPERVLGLVISPVQERTGRVVPSAFWPALEALREETGVPVVSVETPAAYYRSGLGAFATSGLPFTPDVLTWWSGGQLGFVHVQTPYRVAKPLTLVSTWDGDELSLVQAHHQLRAARKIDVAAASAALDRALDVPGLVSRGLGLYRVLEPGSRADAIVEALAAEGLRARPLPNGCIALAPPLDRAAELAPTIGAALRRVP